MTDYISREAVLKGRNELLCHDVNCNDCPFSGYGAHPVCELSERISNISAADVAPVVHAEWVEWFPGDIALIMTGEEMLWECSHCTAKYAERSNYCPNCGSRMDGGEQDETD